MPALDARGRRKLPKTAFAYVDSKGRGHLPIHDLAHLRNAMARFNQTRFENEAARDKARERILRAARKHGIVPVGFVAALLRAQQAGSSAGKLPVGDVSFLLCDIEESTPLIRRLGDGYADVLADIRRLLRSAVRRAHGREVDARADEFFAVFVTPDEALAAAVDAQRRMAAKTWPGRVRINVRMGIHTGRASVTEAGYVGLDVHIAARVCSAAHGGQILISDAAFRVLTQRDPGASGAGDGGGRGAATFRSLGAFALHGLDAPQTLHQALIDGLPADFPPPRTAAYSYATTGEVLADSVRADDAGR